MRDRTKSLYDFAIHQVQFSANLISTASAVLFLYPPPPNFAKIHKRLGRGRLGVGCRDLIPPGGTPGVPGRPARGLGQVRRGRGCAGAVWRARGGVPGAGLPGARGCAGAAASLGARGLCRGGGFSEAHGAAVSPRHTGRLFPGRKKVFPAKIFPHAMYKEARGAGLRKLVDKAIFGPIVWWVHPLLFPAKRVMNVLRRRAGAHPQRPGPKGASP